MRRVDRKMVDPEALVASVDGKIRTCKMCRCPVYVPKLPPGHRLEIWQDLEGVKWIIPHTPMCPIKKSR